MLNRERSSRLKTQPLVPALPQTGCVVLGESLSFQHHCLHLGEGGTNLSGRVEVCAPVTAGVGEVVGVQRQQAFRERGAPLGAVWPPRRLVSVSGDTSCCHNWREPLASSG